VPVVVLDHLTETQRRAYVLADNRLALSAGWDEELLRTELKALEDETFDLELIGFSDEELGALLTDKTPEGLTDPDESVELTTQPVSGTGDIWQLGNHRIVCGDATNADEVERVLAGVRPHLMVTDPPYGVEYDPKWRARAGVNSNRSKMGEVSNDDRADWREAWQLFPGNVAYIWHAGLQAATVQQSIETCGFTVRSQIIWSKDRFALSRGDYHWKHEPCWYAVKGTGTWHGDRSQCTLWEINSREDSGHGHSTQKPVECMRRPMLNNSSAGQAVYDPFSGSGTSIIAAEMEGRHCYAIELNPAYVDMAVERWQNFTRKEARHAESGRTFASVKATTIGQRPEAGRVRTG
jgi:DNA modification methylase